MTSKDEQSSQTRLCLICGDNANGVHYNVLSCEGCKSFFLRSIKSEALFKCSQGGHCLMDLYTRRHCPACRLAKCRRLGMSEAKVWDQNRLCTRKALVRKVGKKRKEEKCTKLVEVIPLVKPTDYQMELVAKLEKAYEMSKNICREYMTRAPVVGNDSMETHNLKFENVEISQDHKQSTSSQIEICQELRKYAMDMFAVSVRQLIGFAREIPGFLQLTSDDQAVLIRDGVIDSLLLRLAEFFVINENKIVNDLGDTYDLKMISALGLPSFSETSFKFLAQVKGYGLTSAEYGLMNAAALLAPDRDELTDKKLVEKIQLEIIMAMQVITKINHPKQPSLFADLIIKIARMREISLMHQQDILKMKVLQQDFTPLVAELFNV